MLAVIEMLFLLKYYCCNYKNSTGTIIVTVPVLNNATKEFVSSLKTE